MSTVCGRRTSQTAATSAAAATGARRADARRCFPESPPSGGSVGGGGALWRARGGAAIVDESRSTAERLTGEERRDAVDHLRLLVPRPVAGVLDDLDLGGPADRVRVGLCELRIQVRVLGAPDHQRRRDDLC